MSKKSVFRASEKNIGGGVRGSVDSQLIFVDKILKRILIFFKCADYKWKLIIE
jgi:hypothetical protein